MLTLSRREWLVGTAAGAVAAMAAEPAPAFRLGFGQAGFQKFKTADYIKTLAGIGYDCIELYPQNGAPADPKNLTAADRRELRDRIKDSKMMLSSMVVGLREPVPETDHRANLDLIKTLAEFAHDLSPDAPPVLACNLAGKPEEWEKVRDGIAERLREWADAAKSAKIVIAVKPHAKTALHSPEGGLWLHKQVNSPWLKLAYDQSHYAVRGWKLADTLPAIVPHAAIVHVKDVRGTPEKFEFLLSGAGDIDYGEYAKLLRKTEYHGAVVAEASSMVYGKPGYDAVAAAKKVYAALAPAFGRAIK